MSASSPLAPARLRQPRFTPAIVLGRFGFYAALVVLVLVFAALSPAFLTLANGINILQQTSTIGIMAVGETLVILAGGIDVSVGSVLGFGGMVAAMVMREPWANTLVAITLGTAAGLGVGLVNGVIVTRLGIDAFITTLAMLSVVRGIVYIISNQYNVDIPDHSSFLVLGRGHAGGVPLSVIIFAVLFAAAWLLERRTTIGRSIHALGGNQAASRLCGVPLASIRTATYAVSGACAALAGVILTSQVGLAVPYQGTGYELDVIAAVVVGGVSLTGRHRQRARWRAGLDLHRCAAQRNGAPQRDGDLADGDTGRRHHSGGRAVRCGAQPQSMNKGERAMNGSAVAPSLRALLGQGIVTAPGAYDALSALLIEQAGFPAIYLTGNGQTASMLGLPDVGLITLTEMADRVRCTRAVTNVPLIADADVGYGSLLNVRRAMRELEAAGANAVQFEDQVSPKKCGHELGRSIVAISEMEQRLRAAADGRRNPDTLIVARTDARTTHGLPEAIQRGQAYASAGADVIFVESPESEAELGEIAASIPAPTMANMVETGRSPYLSARRLGELGFAIAIYPATAFLAATFAVRAVMSQLRRHGLIEDLSRLATLEDYHKVLGFSEYAAYEAMLVADRDA